MFPLFVSFLLALLSYYFRIMDISNSLHYLGDQIRDWTIVQGSFFDLPLHGTPRLGGDFSWGPIFYWTLWIIKNTIGVFFNNLPHSGPIGVGLIRIAIDVLLFFEILQLKTIKKSLRYIAIFLIAFSPYEASMSGTIWNPVLAVVFTHLSLGIFLYSLRKKPSYLTSIGLSLSICFAIHSHTLAFFVNTTIFIFWINLIYKEKFFLLHLGLFSFVCFLTSFPYLLFHYTQELNLNSQNTISLLIENISTYRIYTDFFSNQIIIISGLKKLLYIPFLNNYVCLGILYILFFSCHFFVEKKSQHLYLIFTVPFMLISILFPFSPHVMGDYFLLTFLSPLSIFICVVLSSLLKPNITIAFCVLVLLTLPNRFYTRNQLERFPAYKKTINLSYFLIYNQVKVKSFGNSNYRHYQAMNSIYRLLGGKFQQEGKVISLN
jgi:hypothetical protein